VSTMCWQGISLHCSSWSRRGRPGAGGSQPARGEERRRARGLGRRALLLAAAAGPDDGSPHPPPLSSGGPHGTLFTLRLAMLLYHSVPETEAWTWAGRGEGAAGRPYAKRRSSLGRWPERWPPQPPHRRPHAGAAHNARLSTKAEGVRDGLHALSKAGGVHPEARRLLSPLSKNAPPTPPPPAPPGLPSARPQPVRGRLGKLLTSQRFRRRPYRRRWSPPWETCFVLVRERERGATGRFGRAERKNERGAFDFFAASSAVSPRSSPNHAPCTSR